MPRKKIESPTRTPPMKKTASAAPSAAPAAKKSAAATMDKKPAARAPVSAPIIDTSLAANAAAAMVAGKASQFAGSASTPAKKESGSFKQLKAGLNQPAGAALGGAFAVPRPSKKSTRPIGGAQQVGHNQTFGADVNRAGVPRRTPG